MEDTVSGSLRGLYNRRAALLDSIGGRRGRRRVKRRGRGIVGGVGPERHAKTGKITGDRYYRYNKLQDQMAAYKKVYDAENELLTKGELANIEHLSKEYRDANPNYRSFPYENFDYPSYGKYMFKKDIADKEIRSSCAKKASNQIIPGLPTRSREYQSNLKLIEHCIHATPEFNEVLSDAAIPAKEIARKIYATLDTGDTRVVVEDKIAIALRSAFLALKKRR